MLGLSTITATTAAAGGGKGGGGLNRKLLKPLKYSEEEKYQKLLQESQRFLDNNDTSVCDINTLEFHSKVAKKLDKYVGISLIGYDRHIETDLMKLSNL